MSKQNKKGRRSRVRRAVLATGGSVLAAAAMSAPAIAAQSHNQNTGHQAYAFRTLDDHADLTFNQLLGINNKGLIAGYFGSGQDAQHPNKGYVIRPNYHQGNFMNDNFPGSVQTQITGLNNDGTKVGFYVDGNNNQIGFFQKGNNRPTQVMDPNAVPLATSSSGTPSVGQLLGVNDRDVAVGFYTDANGLNHGYTYNVDNGNSNEITVPDLPTGTSVTASAINNHNTVVGFFTLPPSGSATTGVTESFIQTANGNTGFLMYPDSTATSALGINNEGEVVGDYVDVMGNMHGFTWTAKGGFTSVDDPNGVGSTTINGVNDHGQLVGFYTDSAKNTDGFLATPSSR